MKWFPNPLVKISNYHCLAFKGLAQFVIFDHQSGDRILKLPLCTLYTVQYNKL